MYLLNFNKVIISQPTRRKAAGSVYKYMTGTESCMLRKKPFRFYLYNKSSHFTHIYNTKVWGFIIILIIYGI